MNRIVLLSGTILAPVGGFLIGGPYGADLACRTWATVLIGQLAWEITKLIRLWWR